MRKPKSQNSKRQKNFRDGKGRGEFRSGTGNGKTYSEIDPREFRSQETMNAKRRCGEISNPKSLNPEHRKCRGEFRSQEAMNQKGTTGLIFVWDLGFGTWTFRAARDMASEFNRYFGVRGLVVWDLAVWDL
jgi:hypothetical protein